jgi:hypothetical protein
MQRRPAWETGHRGHPGQGLPHEESMAWGDLLESRDTADRLRQAYYSNRIAFG